MNEESEDQLLDELMYSIVNANGAINNEDEENNDPMEALREVVLGFTNMVLAIYGSEAVEESLKRLSVESESSEGEQIH